MKLNDLKNAAERARQAFLVTERKAADLQAKAKVAKAKSEEARLEHKRARKAAKQAKKLASAAEDQAREQGLVLAKAQKRLAKALKKLLQRKEKPKAQPAPKKRPAMVSKSQKPTDGSHSVSAAAVEATTPPVIPTV